jgi:hypothetical protein
MSLGIAGVLATAGLAAAAPVAVASVPPAKARRTLEQKLEVLAACGIKLARPFTTADLLKVASRREYEETGWDVLLHALGAPEDVKPRRILCKNLRDLDVESIERDGAYRAIAKSMAAITQGSLVLNGVKDHVDVAKSVAWLSFTLRGRRIRMNCEVDGTLLDHNVLLKFVGLLEAADPSKIYVIYDVGGEEVLVGCVKKTDLKKLNEHGIKFKPLR